MLLASPDDWDAYHGSCVIPYARRPYALRTHVRKMTLR